MSTWVVMRLELRRLMVRPLAWVLGALTFAELAWRFVLLLGRFLGMQVKLAAMPGGPGFSDLVAVPLLSSLLTGGFVPFGLAELALLIVPLLTMSTLAGERSNGTLPLLVGSGTPARAIVLGKYFAVLLWLLAWLALVLAMPLALMHATTLDWGKLAAATLGMVCLLAALTAIGVACSAFASHPATAAAASLLLGLALMMVNLGAQMAGIDNGALNWLALGPHLETLLRGLVSSADVTWFVLVIVVALALAVHRLSAERRRN
ncbi:MAG: ABC transporter permease [Rhodanobacter sp.]